VRSTDRRVIETVRRRTTSGGLCINDNAMHLANHELPFGGVGRSGMGACVSLSARTIALLSACTCGRHLRERVR
jgi:acyl-CoA reductase-like NAD-dependent aldehyde dehydrogenase